MNKVLFALEQVITNNALEEVAKGVLWLFLDKY